jgi:hypothetical protein
MSNLIEDFRNEHEDILNHLRDVKRMGVHTMEGRNQLMSARRELLEHLGKEDDFLYPALRRAAEIDPELAHMLENLDREMQEITAYCIKFFNKYEINGGGIDFFRDFDKLETALEARIEKEEKLLYEKYDQVKQVESAA